MADVKISALPLASTPLAGTEVLPIVQSATTDQVSVANLTAGRAVSAASLTLTTTPLAVGSGGTGLTSLTAGYIPYASSSSALSFSSNLYSTGTNIGIGTSSPGTILDIQSAAGILRLQSTTGTNQTYMRYQNTGGFLYTGVDESAGGFLTGSSYAGYMWHTGAYPLIFATSNTPRMTLDASGRLALGVASTNYKFQVNVGSGINWGMTTGTAGAVPSLKAINDAASAYVNAEIDTAQLAINANTGGNVGIGTTSPSQKLDVVGSVRSTVGSAFIGQNSTTTGVNTMRLVNASGNVYFGVDNSTGGAYGTGTAYSAFIYTDYSTPICFLSNGIERGRIDTSGNLLFGLTSAVGGSRVEVKGVSTTSAAYQFYGTDSAGTIGFYVRNDGVFCTGVGTLSPYNNTTASAANTYVQSNGVLQRSTSSLRYKTEIQDAIHGLSDVLNLRSVTYKGKNDGDKIFGGLIAEEVDAAGLTEFVVYNSEGQPDALHYGNMAGLFVKAIQELAAKVAELEAKI